MKNFEKYKQEVYEAIAVCNSGVLLDHAGIKIKGLDYREIKKELVNWLLQEYKVPILDEVEKGYLSAVLKPFKLYITSVTKDHYIDRCCEVREFIYVRFLTGGWQFPTFKAGTMYKGMVPGRRYTLEELGL